MNEPLWQGFDFRNIELTYTAFEAAEYAREKIAYCDQTTKTYPKANMATLREASETFLFLVTQSSLNMDGITELYQRLQEKIGVEGTGWLCLTRYIEGFLQSQSQSRKET